MFQMDWNHHVGSVIVMQLTILKEVLDFWYVKKCKEMCATDHKIYVILDNHFTRFIHRMFHSLRWSEIEVIDCHCWQLIVFIVGSWLPNILPGKNPQISQVPIFFGGGGEPPFNGGIQWELRSWRKSLPKSTSFCGAWQWRGAGVVIHLTHLADAFDWRCLWGLHVKSLGRWDELEVRDWTRDVEQLCMTLQKIHFKTFVSQLQLCNFQATCHVNSQIVNIFGRQKSFWVRTKQHRFWRRRVAAWYLQSWRTGSHICEDSRVIRWSEEKYISNIYIYNVQSNTV